MNLSLLCFHCLIYSFEFENLHEYTAGDSHFAAGMLLETDYRTLSLMCCGIVLLSTCVQACKVSHEQFL